MRGAVLNRMKMVFTNTTINEALDIIRHRFEHHDTIKDRTKLSMESLEFVSTSTYFGFDRVIYRQMFGTYSSLRDSFSNVYETFTPISNYHPIHTS